MTTGRRPALRDTPPRRAAAGSGIRARRRSPALVAAASVGLLVACTLVWQATSAAFVGTTATPANSWETGVVQLTNDRGATALFSTATEGLLVPGSSGSRCITVTYTGTVDTAASGVRLYRAMTTDSPELADALQVTVQMSTTAVSPAPDADCLPAAFPASPVSYAGRAFSAFPTAYATGIGDADGDAVGDWRPSATSDRTRTYRIFYSLPAGPYPGSMQGKKVGMTFTWEVRSSTPGA